MNLHNRVTQKQAAVILKEVFPELINYYRCPYPVFFLDKNIRVSLPESSYSFRALYNTVAMLCEHSQVLKRYIDVSFKRFLPLMSEKQEQAVAYFEGIADSDFFYVFRPDTRYLYMILPEGVILFTMHDVQFNSKAWEYPLTASFISEVRNCGVNLKIPEAPKASKVKTTDYFSDTKTKSAKEQRFTLRFSGNVTGAISIPASSEEEAVTKLKDLIKNSLPQNASFSLNYCLTDGAADEKK